MSQRLLLVLATATVAGTVSLLVPSPPPPPVPHWTLLGWNDLGMHCMDSDYSVFSILPPFNTIEAQLVDTDGDLVTNPGGITVTYEAIADPQGSINTSSVGKTNYWDHATALYGGSSTVDTGLAGHDMPGAGNVAQPMSFVAGENLFRADGIPLTPYDDLGRARNYPMMRLTARSAGGTVLATTDIVLPVSDEMDCSACHASGAGPDAQPTAGWVHDAIHERDYRLNVLRLHDELQVGEPRYAAALAAKGYDLRGLEATARGGTPILCAGCHASNALPGTGEAGISPLTQAMHAGHATVNDPVTGMSMDSDANRSSCYRCHPGSETRCLRGAMGAAVDANSGALSMQCQSCHGSMSVVGDTARNGWLEEPNCQSCHTGTATHNNGQIRYETVFEPDGSMRVPVDRTFATEADTPAPGTSLFRFSNGHGGLRCSVCHGSTHAVFPAAHGNDNLQSEALQGHIGTLVECQACHDEMPETANGGPHGMHSIDNRWARDHGDAAEHGGLAQCRACHGADDRGTVLSRVHADRTITTEFGTRNFFRGQTVGCYECHNGPNSESRTRNNAPHINDGSATTRDLPVVVTLSATDPDNQSLSYRIVKQPAHGTVGLVGTQATYYPEPGFAGEDAFTVAASDGQRESNLGTVRITRLASSVGYGMGFPGTGGAVLDLSASAPPAFGGSFDVVLDNPSGAPTPGALLFGVEPARESLGFGGQLLVLRPDAIGVAVQAGGASYPLTVPTDPNLLGVVVHVQALELDAGARFGVAFSRGLRLVLGD